VHRIRKRQFSFCRGTPSRRCSLKHLWAHAWNSGARMLTESRARSIKPRRIARKVFDGGGLYLLVTPKGGRCWRYAYRFAGKHKTLSLGMYPDVPLDRARSRHGCARNLLAHGIDPAALKAAIGKSPFIAILREWERSQSASRTILVSSQGVDPADCISTPSNSDSP
jgi:hypothetical protein